MDPTIVKKSFCSYRVFDYLVDTPERTPLNCVYLAYTQKTIGDYIVLRDAEERKYYVVHPESLARNLLSHYDSLEREKELPDNKKTVAPISFHEISVPCNPTRLRFDIDAAITPDSAFQATPEQIEDFENQLADCIFEVIKMRGCNFIEKEYDIAIQDASIPGKKFSRHYIVCTTYYKHIETMREDANAIIEKMPEMYRSFIDAGIYSRNHSLRTVYSDKVDEETKKFAGRPFIPVSNHQMYEHLFSFPYDLAVKLVQSDTSRFKKYKYKLITDSPIIAPKEFNIELRVGNQPLGDAFIDRITPYIDDAFTVRSTRNNMIILNRVKPSHCNLCDRTHTKDNTGMITLFPNGKNSVSAYFICRRAEGKRELLATFATDNLVVTENTDELVLDKKQEKAMMKRIEKEAMAETQMYYHNRLKENISRTIGKRDEERTADYEQAGILEEDLEESRRSGEYYGIETLFTVDKYFCSERVPSFAELGIKPNGHYCITSHMGSGKTYRLLEYIKSREKALGRRLVVVMVSFRISFTINKCEEFDAYDYRSIKGHITPKPGILIVQFDSLSRMRFGGNAPNIDMLVLDESESIIQQMDSSLMKHSRRADCLDAFKYIVQSSRLVISMDANTGRRTLRVLENCLRDKFCIRRSQQTKGPAVDPKSNFRIIHHINKYNSNRYDINLYWKESDFTEKLYAQLEEGKKIVVPVLSREVAQSLAQTLHKKYPEREIKLYCGESAKEEKNELKDVNKAWVNTDILIYTPTISAGISFDLERFDVLFGWFNNMTADYLTATQMLNRVRKIKSNQYHLFFRILNLEQEINTQTSEYISYQKILYSSMGEISNVLKHAYPGSCETNYLRVPKKFNYKKLLKQPNPPTEKELEEKYRDKPEEPDDTRILDPDSGKMVLKYKFVYSNGTLDDYFSIVEGYLELVEEDSEISRNALWRDIAFNVSTENRVVETKTKYKMVESFIDAIKRDIKSLTMIGYYRNEDPKKVYENIILQDEREAMDVGKPEVIAAENQKREFVRHVTAEKLVIKTAEREAIIKSDIMTREEAMSITSETDEDEKNKILSDPAVSNSYRRFLFCDYMGIPHDRLTLDLYKRCETAKKFIKNLRYFECDGADLNAKLAVRKSESGNYLEFVAQNKSMTHYTQACISNKYLTHEIIWNVLEAMELPCHHDISQPLELVSFTATTKIPKKDIESGFHILTKEFMDEQKVMFIQHEFGIRLDHIPHMVAREKYDFKNHMLFLNTMLKFYGVRLTAINNRREKFHFVADDTYVYKDGKFVINEIYLGRSENTNVRQFGNPIVPDELRITTDEEEREDVEHDEHYRELCRALGEEVEYEFEDNE